MNETRPDAENLAALLREEFKIFANGVEIKRSNELKIQMPEAKQVSGRKIEGSLTCDFEAGALYTVKMKTGKPHNVVVFPWQ